MPDHVKQSWIELNWNWGHLIILHNFFTTNAYLRQQLLIKVNVFATKQTYFSKIRGLLYFPRQFWPLMCTLFGLILLFPPPFRHCYEKKLKSNFPWPHIKTKGEYLRFGLKCEQAQALTGWSIPLPYGQNSRFLLHGISVNFYILITLFFRML